LNAGSNAPTGHGAIEPPEAVQQMFDRIVPRYDLMNKVMTGGMDRRWRDLAVKAALESHPKRAVDVATGTGDFTITLAEAKIPEVVGLDFSAGMISTARVKTARYPQITLIQGDAMALPFEVGEFDSLTVGFGLRNMPDYQRALNEMVRVVRSEGRVVILEMTPLPPSLFSRLFDPYFRHVVPIIGGLITGDRSAYRYLPESVANFPDSDTLKRMLTIAGCSRVNVRLLGGGTVALHTGEVGRRK
jgi:demethylmenaquinone methyltransferase / 2-methoxy-6-polyprenyl-1,4-benzoquinol methylase